MPLSSYEFEDSNGKLLLEDYDGRPWVLAKDVYTYIGYQNGSRDVRRHVSDRNLKVLDLQDSMKPKRGTPRRIFLNQEGVMELLVNAKQMETTKDFREKFNNVVIPESIKHLQLAAATVPVPARQIVEIDDRYKLALTQIFDAQAHLSRQNAQILQQNTEILAEIKALHSAMKIDGRNWRDAARFIINSLGNKTAAQYRASYHEIYGELEKRAGVKLAVRKKNLQARMGKKNLTYLDVIAEDKKLIAIFTGVLQAFAIQHNIKVEIAEEKGAA